MIPSGWIVTTLGQVCNGQLQTGPFGSQLRASEYTDEGVPVVMPTNLIDGKIDTDSAARIPMWRANELKRHWLEPGDIVFSRRGDVSRAALVTEQEAGSICGTGCLRARPVSQIVDSRFLSFFIQTASASSWLVSNAVGQTMLNLNTTILSELPIKLPLLKEQVKIAAVLSLWDEAINRLIQMIEFKKQRKRGLMQVLLTGKKRFTEYAHLSWQSAPLADYVASARKGKPASLNDNGRGMPYIGSAAFDGEYTSYTDDPSAVRCVSKDVLLLWDGEYAGKSTTGHVGAVGSTVVAITLKPGLDHVYLHNLLLFHNQRIRSIREGSGIPHMPGDFFTWFKPHLPPIEEQRKIAFVLSTADEALQKLEAQLKVYELQKRGLMQQLLTGKKRVQVESTEALPA